jgi:pyroglutamyl-peptidase
MPSVLVTGFGPYGNTPTNPAQGVAEALHGSRIGGAELVGRVVPCVFFDAIAAVVGAIREVRPELVVMLGEFGGRAMLTVERIAQNLDDASRYGLADNAGKAPVDEPIVPDGPAAHYATLPIRAMVKAIRAAGIPADISDAPGTLVCNHLMYGVLHHIAEQRLPIRAGWIHLPALPSVAALEANLGMPSMTLDTSRAGVEVAIRAALEHEEDIRVPIRSAWQI